MNRPCYHRSELLAIATPSCSTIVVTEQFHPMPVDRGPLAEPVGNDDIGRLSSSEHQH